MAKLQQIVGPMGTGQLVAETVPAIGVIEATYYRCLPIELVIEGGQSTQAGNVSALQKRMKRLIL